jgi:CubicO group peptidase (beta-lactamase class C family)
MNRAHLGRALALVLLLTAAGAPARAAAQQLPSDLDALVARTQKEFDVPGVAVAVVKDGKVVHMKGYGVREMGKPAPVDEHTLFGIASNTKAFTTAAIAMLVDEGKLSWDDPVVKHLPSFAMYDPYVTREITVRDLVTHRAGLGLGAGDLMWWPPTTFTRDEILERVRHVKPSSSLRSRYAYNNILYLVAGEVIEEVTGKSWDEFVRERIFQPLGMNETNTSVDDFTPGGNVAIPHSAASGKLVPVFFTKSNNTAPAAAINSSVHDVAKWMIVQLDRGKLSDDKRLWSERQANEMWSAQTIQRIGEPHPAVAALKPNFAAYGLGWGLADYRGHKIVSHTGGLLGMVSKTTLVPDMNLGIVVLTNQEMGYAFQAITYHILDAYLGAPKTDWVAAYAEVRKKSLADAAEAEKKAAAERATGSKPSLPLGRYAGTYRDAWYGDVAVAEENGKLVMRFSRTPALVGDLEHWQYDTFVVRWHDRSLLADAYVTFQLGHDGKIEQAKMEAMSPLTDFSFDFHDLLLVPAK